VIGDGYNILTAAAAAAAALLTSFDHKKFFEMKVFTVLSADNSDRHTTPHIINPNSSKQKNKDDHLLAADKDGDGKIGNFARLVKE
uniref:Uncharacterized protein n=1 Tax=Seriola dumerili TaxID=41447 RepID=A0A3B4V3T2_SERDU